MLLQNLLKDAFDAGRTSTLPSGNLYQQTFKDWFSRQQKQLDRVICFKSIPVADAIAGHKSIFKLDRNFHIYVHGTKKKIEHGADEKGTYVKLYYENIIE